jgi:hypothetical protein
MSSDRQNSAQKFMGLLELSEATTWKLLTVTTMTQLCKYLTSYMTVGCLVLQE